MVGSRSIVNGLAKGAPGRGDFECLADLGIGGVVRSLRLSLQGCQVDLFSMRKMTSLKGRFR